MIPKIIHQTAPKDKNKWHPIWEQCHKSWKINFPENEYQHIMWTDEDIDIFVKNEYPQYYTFFNNLPFHIMQIDFVRYCVLHKYGGIYADMDLFCYKNFYSELSSNICLTESNCVDEIVQNSLMVSEPNHIFFKACIDFFKITDEDMKYVFDKAYFVKKKSGPYYLSEVFKFYKFKNEIQILSADYFNGRYDTFDHEYRTRHMLTNIWGSEDINFCLEQTNDKTDLKQVFKNSYNLSKKINLDTFDFYKNQ